MYKLLIVDDNQRDRDGIRNITNWESMGITIVGACSDGSQVLAQVEAEKPDIILADIAMPVMDGIEMAEKLKERHQDIKIIFMSCHSDFEYAKSAIDLDINGYVMKPIVRKELIDVIQKVLCIYETENIRKREINKMMSQIQASLPMVQEQFLRELLFNDFHDEEEIHKRADFLQLDLPKEIGCIQVICIRVKERKTGTNSISMEERYLVNFNMKEVLQALSGRKSRIHTVQISDTQFAAILLCNKRESTDTGAIDIAVEAFEELNKKTSVLINIGISNTSKGMLDMRKLYRQALDAANTGFYGAENPIILYREIEETGNTSLDGSINIEVLYKEVKSIVTGRSDEEIRLFVDNYYHSESFKTEMYIKNLTFTIINALQIALMESGRPFKDIFGDETIVWKKILDFESIKDIRQWLLNMFMFIQEDPKKRRGRNYKFVEEIMKFIHSHYYEQINIGDIAGSVYLSGGHANFIFKEETGKTIYDYLIEYRMEMAKKLLKEAHSKIYLVAQNIGYTNKSHFCLLFKKYTGFTPSEFKERF